MWGHWGKRKFLNTFSAFTKTKYIYVLESLYTSILYFKAKTLSALGLNLSIKAETYSDPTLRPVFMLNNYHYILKSLRRWVA